MRANRAWGRFEAALWISAALWCAGASWACSGGGGGVLLPLPDDAGADAGIGEPWTGDDADPEAPNAGWIGGACEGASSCVHVEAPVCLRGEEWPGGTCAEACERLCPDRDGPNSVTFCVEVEGEGRCLSRCDVELYGGDGCRAGYACRIVPRFGQSGVQQSACVPEGWSTPAPSTDCRAELDALGIVWAPWDYSASADPATGQVCTVDDPIRVSSPVNGVTYRYYNQDTASPLAVTCEMALALYRLGDALRALDIMQVLHIGTFNCRPVSGTGNLSQHAHGNAIDIWGLVDARGQDYILERDWEHDTASPRTERGQLLYELAQRMHHDRIFNTVLTPNYNAGHDNHYHVDLKPGARFLGYGASPWGELDTGEDTCGAP